MHNARSFLRDCMRLACVAAALCAAGGSAKTYTLKDLHLAAIDNSEELKVVKEEIEKADAQIDEARSGAFPTLDFNTNYQYSFAQYVPYGSDDLGMDTAGMGARLDALYDGFAQALPEPYATDIQVLGPAITQGTLAEIGQTFSEMIDFELPPHTLTFGLSLQQPIFAQGKVTTGLRIARHYQAGLLCKYEAAEEKVCAEITKLFYGALLAGRNVEIQQEAVALATETHRLTRVRFSVGRASELDTLVSRLALEKSQIDYRDAQTRKRVTFDALIKASGVMDNIESMQLEGDFPEDDYRIELEEALSRTRTGNKKLVQLQSGQEIQEQLVRLAKTDYLPMVYCGASVSKISQFDEFSDIQWYDDQKVFAGLTLNLFSGLKRTHKLRQARADQRSFEQTRQQATEGLELATRSAWENVETSREKLTQTKAVLSLARKGYDISKKAYEVGQITLLDFQKSELELNGAKMALNAAKFAFHSAVLDLKVLMGEYSGEAYTSN
ncbi:MAG: hypothetical protein GF418_14200 [Chitinivibrionales bacterium]|nr:hypothetical protein [Chitinivibrionales bacterium]MBD3396771.1 hypothetical protein [Chitinivibrionales bacterium]